MKRSINSPVQQLIITWPGYGIKQGTLNTLSSHRHAKHLQKLKEMKPAIGTIITINADNNAPIGFGLSEKDKAEKARRDLKRQSKEQGFVHQIKQQNKRKRYPKKTKR
jgi:hypothetical protein